MIDRRRTFGFNASQQGNLQKAKPLTFLLNAGMRFDEAALFRCRKSGNASLGWSVYPRLEGCSNGANVALRLTSQKMHNGFAGAMYYLPPMTNAHGFLVCAEIRLPARGTTWIIRSGQFDKQRHCWHVAFDLREY